MWPRLKLQRHDLAALLHKFVWEIDEMTVAEFEDWIEWSVARNGPGD